jgi:penicillin-binding protein 2
MRRRTPLKNYLQEIQLVTQRSIVALVAMIILVLLLIVRLGYLQLGQHALYTTLSQKNSLDLIPIEPTRGLIFDRNGVLLAENLPVFSLDIIPYKVDNLPKALSEIAKIIPLNDTDIMQFQKQLKQHRRFDEIPLKLKLSEEEVAKFAENMYQFPGFLIKARLIRHYPFNTSLSHVLGYIGRINVEELEDIDPTNYSATNYIGKQGIEKYYEDELHGTVGYEQVENDASGEPIRVLNQITPVPGKNLYLTLDSKLQIAAESALQGHRGAIVAIQPNTGQVLAMVSEPNYDPNVFVAGISTQDYQTLQNSPDKPLFNRALRGLYPPASTVKPYVALEGLDSGVTSPDFTIFDPGWYKLKNSEHLFHDWRFHGHGTVNLNKAIVSSCDTYFYDLSTRLGIQRIDRVLNAFGFGEQSGIDLDDELPGVVASPSWKRQAKGLPWYPGDTLISAIGQGYMQATPLQLAVAVAAMANQGRRMTPYLVYGEQLPGKAFHREQPTIANKVDLDLKNWKIIVNAMQMVATSPEGTGKLHFHDAPYAVAMKTGTAQVFKKKRYEAEDEFSNQDNLPERLRNHSLLIAFAPADNPKIAIAVVVENSKLAATVAREVLDYYLVGPPKVVVPEVKPGDSKTTAKQPTPQTANDKKVS